MIKCSSCGHENVPGTQFCEGCGEELPQDNGAAPADAAPQAMIKCPACDNMNPADNVACEVCGAELSGGAAPAVPVPAAAPDMSASLPIAPIPADLADPSVGALSHGAMTPFDDSDNTAPATTPLPDVAPLPDVSLPTTPMAAPVTVPMPAGNLAPGNVKLVVEQGQTVGAQFVLGDAEMLVGREDTDEDIYPDIDLADQDAGYVHRKHATLRFDNGNLSVEHLGGSNKTRINNKPIPDNEPQPLKLGDKVSFGKVVLRLLPV